MTTTLLRGVAASPGLADGVALRYDGSASAQRVTPATDVAHASQLVVTDLRGRIEEASTAEGRAVLEALVMFASDPELLAQTQQRVDSGEAAPDAVRAAAGGYAVMLRGLGGYMAERADDVVDVGERLAAALEGRVFASLPSPGHPYVLVAKDLAPADTALLDPAVVIALVTEQGGPTSHTAILARSLGIPAVVAIRGARDVMDHQRVVVDGSSGEVHVDPTFDAVAELARREEVRLARLSAATGPGATSDGVSVPLLVNVGTVRDAEAAAGSDAEGVGLFRTEFLFLGRQEEPTLDEQVEQYSSVLTAFAGRRVVFRTLDAGSDKPLPFLHLPDEENPALGVRGLRTARVRPDILDTQLTAIAIATERTGGSPWVMAPMVATVDEARWFARVAADAGLRKVGVMIEVPAAALRSAQVLAEVSFASIGTNDLGQYALAADRQLGELGSLLDPWQPGLLELVAATCRGGEVTGASVGVCGEAAADPELALVLVGLGVRSLSMSPVALQGVRGTLGSVDLATCREAASRALAASSAQEARAAVKALVG